MTRRSQVVLGGLASDVFPPTLLLANISAKSMVRDFGRGRPNVRAFWDTAHSLEQIIDAQALEVRLRRLEDRDRPISLIYFGLFVPYKGLELMVKAVWKAACTSGRRFVLDLAGSGDDSPRLRARVDELGAGETIRSNAPLPYGPGPFSKGREADLALATPLSEDTPRSAFHAMASGLPILGLDIDHSLSLAVESKADETSPWPDADVFARRIVNLHRDRVRLAGISRAAVDFGRANTQEIWLDRRIRWTLALLESPEKSSFAT